MNIHKFTLFSYLSIKDNLLFPLDKFLSNSEVIEICKNTSYNKKFFPLPFFLSADEKDLKDTENNEINLFFNKKSYGTVKIKSISFFDKNKMIDLLFKKIKQGNFKHPFKEFIKQSGNYLIETEPFSNKKKIINKKLIGFATRNIPHKGHEKIIKHFSKNKKLIVNIFENSSNDKKIDSSKTLIAYKKFIKKNKLNSIVSLKKIKLPSFLLGPRQAALHAIVGKNLSCDSYIIGRDHSGYKNFYGVFDSVKYCKRIEKKIGVKIFDSGSPVFCKTTQQVMFRKECTSKDFIDISASLVRNTKNKKLKKQLSNF